MIICRIAFAVLVSAASLTTNAQTEIEGRGMSQVGYNEQLETRANHHTAVCGANQNQGMSSYGVENANGN